MNNIFMPNQSDPKKEQFDTLLLTPNLYIEKITSNGQISSEWYEQEKDEWVLLIEGEGELLFDDGQKVRLVKGEHIHIPRMKRHKVIYTSSPAIWLAVYFNSEQ